MNAPERLPALAGIAMPEFIKRKSPARYGWWSDRTLMIVKGDETLTLDADDLAGLRRFFNQFDMGGEP